MLGFTGLISAPFFFDHLESIFGTRSLEQGGATQLSWQRTYIYIYN